MAKSIRNTLIYNGIPSIPMRKEANHRSEMVSELLHGEPFRILESLNEEWVKIQTELDQYTAWVSANQLCPLSKPTTTLITRPIAYNSNGQIVGYLSGYTHPSAITDHPSTNDTQPISQSKEKLIAHSKAFLGTPYLWGGKTLHGIDCSGFVQVIFRQMNQQLPRDAYQQVQIGDNRSWNERQVGDLAFFRENGRISHVGILLDANQIIHASGWVRIDQIDQKGIIHNGKYTHELDCIKNLRIFD